MFSMTSIAVVFALSFYAISQVVLGDQYVESVTAYVNGSQHFLTISEGQNATVSCTVNYHELSADHPNFRLFWSIQSAGGLQGHRELDMYNQIDYKNRRNFPHFKLEVTSHKHISITLLEVPHYFRMVALRCGVEVGHKYNLFDRNIIVVHILPEKNPTETTTVVSTAATIDFTRPVSSPSTIPTTTSTTDGLHTATPFDRLLCSSVTQTQATIEEIKSVNPSPQTAEGVNKTMFVGIVIGMAAIILVLLLSLIIAIAKLHAKKKNENHKLLPLVLESERGRDLLSSTSTVDSPAQLGLYYSYSESNISKMRDHTLQPERDRK